MSDVSDKQVEIPIENCCFVAEHAPTDKVCLGEMASFYIPARLAYGAEGSLEEGIPPNADLVYKVEVLDIESELELAL